MKTRLKILNILIVLFSTFATTAAFGQIITWTNINAQTYPGGNLGRTTNWSGGSPISGAICTFDGTVSGSLTGFSADGIDGAGGANIIGGGYIGASGISIDLTPTQTSSLNVICYTGVTSSVSMGFNAFRVQSGAGQLTFGDNSARQLVCQLRPSSSLHAWINNSANPVVINPNLQIWNGGAAPGHIMNFQGTGDFNITNALRFNNSAPPGALQWDSTGTTIWASDGGNGTSGNTNLFNSALGAVTINAGTVIVQNAGLLPSSFGATTTVNNGTLIVNGDNSAGSTIVYGGTLGGTGAVGTVTIQSGGTLAPGTSIGTLTISSNLTIGGNMVFEVNKSLAQSNDLVIVSGGLTNTSTGTLTVSNLGPALAFGNKFTLFNKPVQNGGALFVVGAGVLWVNNLAVDGSISVSGGQGFITWIGPNGADFGYGTNWTGDDGFGTTVPNSGTLCTFNGEVPGNLTLYTSNGINGSGIPMGPGIGAYGISIYLTPSQTGSVTLACNTNLSQSAVMGFTAFRVQAGAGPLILGDGSSHQIPAAVRPLGSHAWINFGSSPVIINPNFQILNGGGGAPGHIINFQGTGDFAITNNLRWNNNAPAGNLQWDSTGTSIWSAGGVNNLFNSPLGNVVVNAGKVIVVSTNLLPITTNTTTVSNGTLIVNGNNAASSITVNGGTLGGMGAVGTVTIQSGGTLAPGASVGIFTISSNLNIGGNLLIEVNKSLAQSNDLVVVTAGLTNTGTGTLTVSNLGPALAVGDKFTLFNKPVQNGSTLTVTGSGANWANDLAVDGSISVAPLTLNYTNLGGTNLQFSWTGNYKLQSQTNSIDVGLSTNWGDYPGGSSGVIVPIEATKETVFFRLVSP